MPAHFFRFQAAKVEIKDFLCSLIKTVFGQAPAITNSLAFHPEWSISWDTNLPFSCVIDLPSRPNELFVTVKKRNSESASPLIQRQFFTKPDFYCYDLYAFIEYRPDGKANQGNHIAYLKSEGGWYQCDDDRITPMRSNHLNMALNCSTILYYKRIWPK